MRSKCLSRIYIFLLILIYMFTSTTFVFADEKVFSLVPEKTQVKIGEKVKVPIEAKNVQNVYGYELTINYDSSKLKLEDITANYEGYDFIQEIKDDEIRYVFTLIGDDIAELNGDLIFGNVIVSSKNIGDAYISLKSVEVSDKQLNTQQFSPEAKAVIKIIEESDSSGGSGGGGRSRSKSKSQDPKEPEEPVEPGEPGKPEEPEDSHKTFDDIDNYPWAKEAIETLALKGIIRGTSPTTYSPAEPVKRADFMLLLVRALELSSDFEDNFNDVAPGAYYSEALGIAKTLGIAQGVGDNRFNPESQITRQDLMVLIDRAMKVAGKELVGGEHSDLDGFTDKSKIAPYAVESIATLVKNEIVIGDGSFINPLGNATRAETAVLIYRIYNK